MAEDVPPMAMVTISMANCCSSILFYSPMRQALALRELL